MAFADERPDKHGIYRISSPDEKFSGTSFVVKVGDKRTWLATAAHVVCPDNEKKTLFSADYAYKIKTNNTTFVGLAKVIQVDPESDLALLEGLFVVEGLEVLEIDPDPVPVPKRGYTPPRKPAIVLGYGGGTWLETSGYLSFVSGKYVQADCIAVSGQSGGPVISDGKVCGTCSGGNAWYYDDPEKKTGSFTWPLRAASPKRLKEMIDGIK